MAESTTPRRRRVRRSTRVNEQLAAARERHAAQLREQREREERVENALVEYFAAGDRITAAEDSCRRRVEPHEQAITRLRELRDEQVAAERAAQARAALTMHEAGRTVSEVGVLLEVGEKAARQLIAEGRRCSPPATPVDARDRVQEPADPTPATDAPDHGDTATTAAPTALTTDAAGVASATAAG